MKRSFSTLLIVFILTVVSATLTYAQSAPQLQLGLSRDFGYGGFGGDIQGLFTIRVKNPPSDLVRVIFYLDSTEMGEVTASSFSLQFNTDSYPLGAHTLSAVGYTSDGTQLTSDTIQVQFVPASAGTQIVLKIVLPIVGIILIIGIASVVIPLISSKGKLSNLPLGAQRNYGIGGGAICPKCGRPFPLRLWWINVGLSKIDRCPFCGKWSLVRRSSLAELRQAEAAEASQAQSGPTVSGETEEDKLKKAIDDSRFQNP